ncbi:MAG: SipW-dependent-type signal peptide-containing protein, partial [Candidatus Methanomethylophilaceae archaeon]|nr:SipW-dependent-type signal peptide-containing protein [Candidatus Methanomethylophilaceae archaeon]
MNAKITATIAVAVVAAMVFAAAGAVTYSWFSDSEEANIDVNTATVKMDAEYKYCLWGTTPTDWMPVSGSDVDINNVTPNKTI